MIILDKFGKIFDWIGGVAAFFTVMLIAILFINAKFTFIPNDLCETLTIVKEYAVLGSLIVVGFGCACKRGLIGFLLFCTLAAVAFVFSFPALF